MDQNCPVNLYESKRGTALAGPGLISEVACAANFDAESSTGNTGNKWSQ